MCTSYTYKYTYTHTNIYYKLYVCVYSLSAALARERENKGMAKTSICMLSPLNGITNAISAGRI